MTGEKREEGLGRNVTDVVAIERGYPWVCRAPRGHTVTRHSTREHAEKYLRGYLRKTGCVVVDLREEVTSGGSAHDE